MKPLAPFVLMLVAGAALAKPVFTPNSIIVNPVDTALEVQTWLDRDQGGNNNANYTIGDPIQISVNVNQAAYVYLFDIDTTGAISMIMPNALNSDNYLNPNETRRFPEQGAKYKFNVGGPAGVDQVVAVASATPLSMSDIADIKSGQGYISGGQNLFKQLSIVVTPIEQTSWTSDTVWFNVNKAGTKTNTNTNNGNANNNGGTKPKIVIVQPQNMVVVEDSGNNNDDDDQAWVAGKLDYISPVAGWPVFQEDRHEHDYLIVYKRGNFRQAFNYYKSQLERLGWKLHDGQGSLYNFRRGKERLRLEVIAQQKRLEVKLHVDH